MNMNSGLWPASAISCSTTSSRGSTTTGDNITTRTTNNVAATRHYQCSRLPLGTSASNFTLPRATSVKNFAQLLRHVLAALRSKILKQSIRSDTGWVTRKPIQENLLVHESAGQDCWGPWLIPLSTSEGLGTWTKGNNKKHAMRRITHCTIMSCDVMGQQHPPNKRSFKFLKLPTRTLCRASFRRVPFFSGAWACRTMALWHTAHIMVPGFCPRR